MMLKLKCKRRNSSSRNGNKKLILKVNTTYIAIQDTLMLVIIKDNHIKILFYNLMIPIQKYEYESSKRQTFG